jgi:hypothetical protein
MLVVARSNEGQGGEKAGGRPTRNLYQMVIFLHAGVVFYVIILQIYPCNNEKYINANGRYYHGHNERYCFCHIQSE